MTHTLTPQLATTSLKWIARAGSLFSVALILMFLGGFHPSDVRLREWIGLAFFPFGVVIGLLLAWWKPGTGAFVALGSLSAFYLIYGLLLGSNVRSWAFVVFASPAFFFLLYWVITKTNSLKVK